GILGRIEEIKSLPNNKIVLVTTGSQGEPTSALVRMANRDHKHVHIQRGDTIILSSTPVPGNESLVNRTVDSLFRQGAQVIYSKLGQVHVHGHGSQEELKLILSLVKPRFFAPIHGEYRHLSLHARLAESVGIPPANIFVLEDGDVLELNSNFAKINGKVNSGHVYVDGLSVGDIGGVVLRTRRMLSRDGIVFVIITVNRQTGKLVGHPDIVSRGFIDERDFGDMMEESRQLLYQVLEHSGGRIAEGSFINTKVRDTLDKFYYDRTKRRPMILPFMVKV
ncbi:MAG: ribonuclease J, partial [Dehalococcoidales bacterium]